MTTEDSIRADAKSTIYAGSAAHVRLVILNEVKNLVPRVHCLGLCKAKSICICEILRFAQNDKVKVVRWTPTLHQP